MDYIAKRTVFAPLHSAEQKSGANMPQLGRKSETPKNLTSDWLIVTALSFVIGHLFIASVQQCVCGQCIAVQWTGHGRVQMCTH